ncbi:hypothetical protein RI444_07610 [Paenarthrobacter sp. AT5]|uniref:hypothetical protein n=1 Tax=Paenarthrobacter TaxID=1742992 RepID=UPI001A982057|nr:MULTISPECIES: hypothetical protein [Paenarthrobacter]QSZ54502.1 hypothetical protein AYX19_16950 [Paenarthrobacter ureafaciens]WOC62477.1 hypothetical protein RI444_07610 [Paenarthrobacter sp. AT5]
MTNATITVSDQNVTYSTWLDQFEKTPNVTAAALAEFQEDVSHERYATTVLNLARAGKLSPELITDAAYTAWLGSENPKKNLSGGDWAELFRLAYNPDHEFFDNGGAK